MKEIILDKTNSKIIGRSLLLGENRWVALSGAGVAFSFRGKYLKITLLGSNRSHVTGDDSEYARFAVLMDGVRVLDDVIDRPKKSYEIIREEKIKICEIQIIKLSEAPMSAMAIAPIECDEEAVISPLTPKMHSIEFIGDSITCGYGVDETLAEDHVFSTRTEDVTKAYAYKTAQLLDADYSMFSCSGYGIISGYTGDSEVRTADELIPPYYESQCFSRDDFGEAGKPDKLPWDFSEYQPEVVVINLGTNDFSFCQDTEWKQEEYRQKYTEFIKVVRKNNPKAYIFAVLGLMGDGLYEKLCQAVADYTEHTGDIRIAAVHIPEQNPEDGYAVDWHPLPKSHTMAAEVVAGAIRETLGW
ncbi:MAG: hypothetical protein IKL22_11340 [Lachnospiraceae bacterium]|nr:hypothetical protein [Lachnospiraceae bacterium]